jgi:stress responsive A/B barrel domain protein
LTKKYRLFRAYKIFSFIQLSNYRTHDLVLILDVNDEDALNKYATSKEHVAIVESLIKPNTNSRVAIDFFY